MCDPRSRQTAGGGRGRVPYRHSDGHKVNQYPQGVQYKPFVGAHNRAKTRKVGGRNVGHNRLVEHGRPQ